MLAPRSRCGVFSASATSACAEREIFFLYLEADIHLRTPSNKNKVVELWEKCADILRLKLWSARKKVLILFSEKRSRYCDSEVALNHCANHHDMKKERNILFYEEKNDKTVKEKMYLIIF